ncbi:MAG: hypothetical protein ACLP62_06550, partial [Acidimicrobiales bacterium]
MVNGKQVQRTFRGTRAAARKALKGLDVRPTPPAADVRTFGDLLDEWVKQWGNKWAPKTTAENVRQIDQRIRPRLGD